MSYKILSILHHAKYYSVLSAEKEKVRYTMQPSSSKKEPPTHVPIMSGVLSLLSRMNSNRYVMVTDVL